MREIINTKPLSVVYNEDCVVGMKRYADKYFDLAIVDPPYAVGASNGNFGRGGKKSKTHAYIAFGIAITGMTATLISALLYFFI